MLPARRGSLAAGDRPSEPSVEAARRGRDHGRARRRHLAHLQRPVGDAVAAEAEGAVDAGEALRIAQRPGREGAADRPVRRRPARSAAPRHSPGWRAGRARRCSGRGSGCGTGCRSCRTAPRTRRRASATLAPILPSLAQSSVPSRRGCGEAARSTGTPRQRRARHVGDQHRVGVALREQAGGGAAHAGRRSDRRSACRPGGRCAPSTAWVIARRGALAIDVGRDQRAEALRAARAGEARPPGRSTGRA